MKTHSFPEKFAILYNNKDMQELTILYNNKEKCINNRMSYPSSSSQGKQKQKI